MTKAWTVVSAPFEELSASAFQLVGIPDVGSAHCSPAPEVSRSGWGPTALDGPLRADARGR
jgi:hypothetical protein